MVVPASVTKTSAAAACEHCAAGVSLTCSDAVASPSAPVRESSHEEVHMSVFSEHSVGVRRTIKLSWRPTPPSPPIARSQAVNENGPRADCGRAGLGHGSTGVGIRAQCATAAHAARALAGGKSHGKPALELSGKRPSCRIRNRRSASSRRRWPRRNAQRAKPGLVSPAGRASVCETSVKDEVSPE